MRRKNYRSGQVSFLMNDERLNVLPLRSLIRIISAQHLHYIVTLFHYNGHSSRSNNTRKKKEMMLDD